MIYGNTRDEGMAQIGSVEGGGRKRSLTCLQIQLAIRESILINILIVGKNIYVPSSVELCLQYNLPPASSYLSALLPVFVFLKNPFCASLKAATVNARWSLIR